MSNNYYSLVKKKNLSTTILKNNIIYLDLVMSYAIHIYIIIDKF
jgi:hypothetical protein